MQTSWLSCLSALWLRHRSWPPLFLRRSQLLVLLRVLGPDELLHSRCLWDSFSLSFSHLIRYTWYGFEFSSLEFVEFLGCIMFFFLLNSRSLEPLLLNIFSALFSLSSLWESHYVFAGILDDILPVSKVCSFSSLFCFYFCFSNWIISWTYFKVPWFFFLSVQTWISTLPIN